MKWPYFTQCTIYLTRYTQQWLDWKKSSAWAGASRAFHRDLYCQRLPSVCICGDLLEYQSVRPNAAQGIFREAWKNRATILGISFCVLVDLIWCNIVYLFMRSLAMRWLRYNVYLLFSSSPFVRSSRMNNLIHIHQAHFLHKNLEHTNASRQMSGHRRECGNQEKAIF